MHLPLKWRTPKFSNIVLEEHALPSVRGNEWTPKVFFSEEWGNQLRPPKKEKRIWNPCSPHPPQLVTHTMLHQFSSQFPLWSESKETRQKLHPQQHSTSRTTSPKNPEHTICTSVCFPEQVPLRDLLTRQVDFLFWSDLYPQNCQFSVSSHFPWDNIFTVLLQRKGWLLYKNEMSPVCAHAALPFWVSRLSNRGLNNGLFLFLF